jgi:hypothetical protein
VEGFEVSVTPLRAAGRAAAGVADGVRAVRLAPVAAALAAAFPGGAAVAASDAVGAAWSSAVARAADALAAYAAAAAASADAYAGAERQAADLMGTAAG